MAGAYTFEELVGSVRVVGAPTAKRDVDSVRGSFRTLGDEIEGLAALGGITFLISQIGTLIDTLGQVTGVGIAAKFQGIARAIAAITGNTKEATKMLQMFQDMGQKTPFDTADIAATGARMLGAGVAPERVGPELQALLDLASHGMGLSREDFPEFMRNLLQIRGRGTGQADMADINQMKDRVPQIGRFLAAGIGGKTTPDDALQQAQGMTGRELYDTIIKGAEAMAKGAAAAAASLDPLKAWANVMETLQLAMAPTGKALLPVVMEFVKFAQAAADVFKYVNEATFGLTGLTVVAGLTAVAIGGLAVAIGTLGTAASTALAGIGIAATAASVIVPVAKVGIGALALFGAGKYLWDKFHPPTGVAGGETKPNDPVVKRIEKTNQLLEGIHATVRGGGPRTAAEASRFVAELQLQKWLAF